MLLNAEKLREKLEATAKKNLACEIICGYNVCVMQNGKTVYKNNFGTLSYDSEKTVSDSTIFRLASMTKPITAAGIMTLAEKGKLSLDDEISKYLPAFSKMKIAFLDGDGKLVVSEFAKTPIKILHLLTHTSGLGSGEVGRVQLMVMPKEEKMTLSSYVNYLPKTALSFEPYTKQEYSGVAAFDVLARIAELVSDTDYRSFLKKSVIDKCGMIDTDFEPTANQWSRIISMSNRVDGKGTVSSVKKGNVFEDYPCTHHNGGAGLVSTLGDYCNFCSMLLNDGTFEGEKVLSKESVDLIRTPHTPKSLHKDFQTWGLGGRVIIGDNTLPKGCYGWSGAYGSHFWIDPENKIAAVYMKNSRYDGGAGSKTSKEFERDVYDSIIQ